MKQPSKKDLKAKPLPEPESEEEEEEEEVEEEELDEEEEEDDEEIEDDDDDDDDEAEDDDEEEEQEINEVVTGTRHEDVVDDLHYDLFNLSASSFHPLRWKNAEDRERVLAQASSRVAQLLYKKLRTLPTEVSDVGPITVLPSETSQLPRATRAPEPKPETRWEKFARDRGINKKKKDRMVYDEATGEYKPRFGYKRGNNGIEDLPIVEVKAGQDPFADPWAEDRKQKKSRVDRNEKNRLRNVSKAEKKMNASRGKKQGGGFDPASMPGIPMDLAADGNKKKGKVGVRNTLQLVQHSTASMGRFDEMRSGEPSRKLTGKKRAFRDNFVSHTDEKHAMKSQLRFVSDKKDKKARGVTNSLAAYEGILPDAPSNSFKKTKGRGKNAEKNDGKGKGKKGKR